MILVGTRKMGQIPACRLGWLCRAGRAGTDVCSSAWHERSAALHCDRLRSGSVYQTPARRGCSQFELRRLQGLINWNICLSAFILCCLTLVII